jgi:hypothetical protein
MGPFISAYLSCLSASPHQGYPLGTRQPSDKMIPGACMLMVLMPLWVPSWICPSVAYSSRPLPPYAWLPLGLAPHNLASPGYCPTSFPFTLFTAWPHGIAHLWALPHPLPGLQNTWFCLVWARTTLDFQHPRLDHTRLATSGTAPHGHGPQRAKPPLGLVPP